MIEIEIWVVVDENGDYAVGKDLDSAFARYGEDIGAATCQRTIKVTLDVPTPGPICLKGLVPAEVSEGAALTVTV